MSEITTTRTQEIAALGNLGWDAEQIDVIKRSVAVGATHAELYQFLYLCKTYNLDPFRREIHFFKDKRGKPSFITGIDGFRKSAKADPAFEGVMAFAVRDGDTFVLDPANYSVTHKFGAKRGKVIGAWARADAKGRRPVLVYVDFNEYNKPGYDAWQKMPATMIAKVAESHAIRRQFGLSGLYTTDEMGVVDTTPIKVEAEIVDVPEPPCGEPDGLDTAYTAEDANTTQNDLETSKDDTQAQIEHEPAESERPDSAEEKNRYKGFWASAHNLGFRDDQVHEIASEYFEIPGLTSLTEIEDLTPSKLGVFLLHLRDLRQGVAANE